MQIQTIEQIVEDITALEACIKSKLEILPSDKAIEVVNDMITDLEALHDLIEELK